MNEAADQTKPDRMHVLIVEDDSDTRANLCDILALDGHSCETAATVADALGQEKWSEFGAIILDRKLPDGTAEELLPHLNRLSPDVPVIVVTGYGDLEGAITAIRHGAADYILKPISPDILRSRLAKIAAHRWLALEKARSDQALRESKKSLQEERDRAQRILDTVEVILVAIHADEKVSLINKKGCQILGYDEGEIIGKNWFDHFLPGRIKDRVKAVFLKLMSGEINPVEYFENPVLTKGGEERVIAWHNTILRDEKGRVYATLSSGEDITEKIELQRQVRQAEKLAGIGLFASGLAHEIGTPLSVIMGRAEFILRKIAPEDPLRESLKKIIGQIERITKIVQQLLSFAKPKSLELRRVGLQSLLYIVLEFFNHQIARQGIALTMNCSQDLPEISVDPDQIQQVLFNIILNALQAMPRGGSLKVDATRTIPRQNREDSVRDGYFKIEIMDSGPGIPGYQLEKIFDPFFTTKEVGKGTGLGLAVSYGIMKAHGGWIRVNSQVGQGTTFGLYFPLGPDPQT